MKIWTTFRKDSMEGSGEFKIIRSRTTEIGNVLVTYGRIGTKTTDWAGYCSQPMQTCQKGWKTRVFQHLTHHSQVHSVERVLDKNVIFLWPIKPVVSPIILMSLKPAGSLYQVSEIWYFLVLRVFLCFGLPVWVKQCHFYHPWPGMLSFHHIYFWWWLGGGGNGSALPPYNRLLPYLTQ